MKAKNLTVLLTLLFFVLSMTFGTALAGDETDPEVDDGIGDTEPGREFRDIDAAWFSETNDTIKISLRLAGPPPSLLDFAQGIDTTTFDYEVYFDVEGTGYAASVSVQYAFVAGTIYTFDVPWVWNVRKVIYAANTDIIQSETGIDGISGNTYEPQLVELQWQIDKEAVGVGIEFEGRGQELVNTWAAVWDADENLPDAQRDPHTQAWDHANTHRSDPGKTYRITGIGGVDYNIVLSVGNYEKVTYGGTPVEFLVSAYNNGTDAFTVDFFPGDYDETWSVVLNPNTTTIARGSIRTISVTVKPPKDVENGTVLVLKIEGDIHIEGGDTVSVQPPLTLKIVALTPPDEKDGGGWLENFVSSLKANLAIIAAVIAVMVVAIIVLVVLIRK
jgi:hypothetical protein